MTVKVGVVGLGMMGMTHLDVYSKRQDVQVVAIADRNEDLLTGKAQAKGNIEGQAQGSFDFQGVKKYTEGLDLINDPDIDVVDICLPTFLHLEYGKATLQAGKHLLLEKPLARTSADAKALVDAAANAKGLAMPAMCMRFWPGWTWLKKAVTQETYGKVKGAQFRRVSNHPGGGFYQNGELCGGALLDLHIHDTDFIQYLFGMPKQVFSRGYSKATNEPDHLVTQYIYDDIPLVVAEGGWAMSDKFPFTMQYTVNFENATVCFDISKDKPLMLCEGDKEPVDVDLEEGMGYEHEINYFIDCVKVNKQPTIVTLEDAYRSVLIAEAEGRSIKEGLPVSL